MTILKNRRAYSVKEIASRPPCVVNSSSTAIHFAMRMIFIITMFRYFYYNMIHGINLSCFPTK